MSGDCKKGENGKRREHRGARGKNGAQRGRLKCKDKRGKTFPYGKELGTDDFKRGRERKAEDTLYRERKNGVQNRRCKAKINRKTFPYGK